MVRLYNEFDTVVFKPLIGVFVIELFEQPFHQSGPSWIDSIRTLHVGKGVGYIATPATGNGNFGQRTALAFVNSDFGVGKILFKLYGGETSGCACSNDGYVHGRCVLS